MDFRILDQSFQIKALVDDYVSAIWTERYSRFGDFAVVMPSNSENLSHFSIGDYIWNSATDTIMLIEDRELNTNVTDGVTITYSGRSLESILTRRVIWPMVGLAGDLQTSVKHLLDKCIFIPDDVNRKIDNFAYIPSAQDLSGLTYKTQFTGQRLYDAIVEMCEAYELGFRITLTAANQFQFQLYDGIDRSYSQSVNPYVVFSPDRENLAESRHLYSDSTLATTAYVAGEGEDIARIWNSSSLPAGAGTGVERRELFVDARDLSQTVDGVLMPENDYKDVLWYRGQQKLAENQEINVFDGEAVPTSLYLFGNDYQMGDILQLDAGYGITARVRVTEYIWSQSEGEVKSYPTLSATVF